MSAIHRILLWKLSKCVNTPFKRAQIEKIINHGSVATAKQDWVKDNYDGYVDNDDDDGDHFSNLDLLHQLNEPEWRTYVQRKNL